MVRFMPHHKHLQSIQPEINPSAVSNLAPHDLTQSIRFIVFLHFFMLSNSVSFSSGCMVNGGWQLKVGSSMISWASRQSPAPTGRLSSTSKEGGRRLPPSSPSRMGPRAGDTNGDGIIDRLELRHMLDVEWGLATLAQPGPHSPAPLLWPTSQT